MLRKMVATLALAGLLLSPSMPVQGQSVDLYWWIFVDSVKPRPQIADSEMGTLLQGHLGNLRRLYHAGKLKIGGPMRDPEGVHAGCALLTVKSRKDVDAAFAQDPFFKRGVMRAHPVPMRSDFGRINAVEAGDPNHLEEDRLVVFSWVKKSGHATRRDAIRNGARVGMVFHGFTTNSDSVREIAFFHGANDAAIKSWLAGDPLVKSGKLRASIYPQFVSEGAFSKRP